MKDFKVNDIDKQIRLSKVIFSYTTTVIDFNVERILLIEYFDKEEYIFDRYILLEGGHCSCYGFDEVEWHGWVLDEEELKRLVLSKDFDICSDTRKKLKNFCKEYFDWREKK